MFKGLKALLAGVIAGVGLGVLFSPKKGKDVRNSIKSEVDEGGTGLEAIKETVVDMGKDIGETCKECYEEISDSDEYKEGTGKLKKYAKNAKKEATKAYKKHVSSGTRKKIKKAVEKAKKKLKKDE